MEQFQSGPGNAEAAGTQAGLRVLGAMKMNCPMLGGHTFNPSIQRQRQADLYEFESRLTYRASSRTAKATQRNTVFGGEGRTAPEQVVRSL